MYVPHQTDLPDLAQRKPNPARVKAIAQYILDTHAEGTTFFPPICINVQPAPTYENGCIVLPYNAVTLRLTDGQHRCFGIRQALKTLQTQRSLRVLDLGRLEIGVLLYAGLSLEHERQAFRDQNLLVQKPSVSFSHYCDRTTPIVLLSKALLECVPYFSDNVEIVDNGLGRHNPKLLTLSTLVSANKHLFPHLKPTEHLQPKIDWTAAFWNAAAKSLPNDPWQQITKEERQQQRKEFLSVHAVFFQALGMLARDLYEENIDREELHQWLARLQEIDWRRENELWRDRGDYFQYQNDN